MPPIIYVEISKDSGLQQGDILDKSPAILSALGKAFPEDLLEKTYAFIVLTQSCDLVRRNKKSCKAKYISLATISPLEDNLIMLLDDACEKACLDPDMSISGLYISKDRNKAHQLIERILNQTEEDRALFYLPPYLDAGIAVHSIANLQVNFALKLDNYDSLIKNLKGRLSNVYQNRLGWLVGNLFSRVAIPDFDQEEKKTIIRELLKRKDSERGPFWISQDAVSEAQSKGLKMDGRTTQEIYELIKSHSPSSPKEKAIERILNILKEEASGLGEPVLDRISRMLRQDPFLANYIRKAE